MTTKKYLSIIGSYAFSDCASLSSLSLTEGLKTIDSSAFSNCDALTSVTVPASVTSINSYAFQNCLNLKEVTLNEGLKSIDSYAFYDCDNLLNVTVPASVTKVYEKAFGDCLRLESVKFLGTETIINDTKTTIYSRDSDYYYYDGKIIGYKDSAAEAYAEKYSRVFEEIYVAPTSGSCGQNLTWSYNADTRVLKIEGTGLMTDYEASKTPWFSYSGKISHVEIGSGVTGIGDCAFTACVIKSVSLPYGLLRIGEYAFGLSPSLSSVYVPDTVTEIGKSAFIGLLGTGVGSIHLPNNLSTLSPSVLANTPVRTVTVPASVRSIQQNALTNCTKLTDVYILNPKCTFYADASPITNSNSSDDPNVFNGTIHGYWNSTAQAFAQKYNYKFEPIDKEFCGETLKWSYSGVICGYYKSTAYQYAVDFRCSFRPIDTSVCGDSLSCSYNASTKTLTVTGTGDMYDFRNYNETPWNDVRDQIETVILSEGVTSIGNSAFLSMRNLKNITLPSTLKRIGDDAFQGTGICSLELPEGLESIGTYAFMYTEDLISLEIPGTVTSFGSQPLNAAFSNAEGTETVLTVGEGITAIPGGFASCVKCKTVYLPESCASIGEGAFEYSSHLTDIYILNKTCEIFDSNQTLGQSASLTVHGYAGSTAQAYAEKYGFSFEPIFNHACGKNLTWSYNETTKTLTVVGTGMMYSYSDSNPAPWRFYASEIETVILPAEGLIDIGSRAFEFCTSLKKITIPNSVRSIDTRAFYCCSSLSSVTLPENLSDISALSFAYTAIKEVTIPASVRYTSIRAFGNCAELKKVTFLGNAPSTFNISTFYNDTASVYYPGDNDTWTEEVMQSITGCTLTWVPYYQTQDLTAAGAVFTLSKTVFPYTGKAVKCGSYVSVKIGDTKLKYGTDFDLVYSNNVDLGCQTAKVKVVGIGAYSGSITKKYSIVPAQQAKPALSVNQSALHVKWAADSNAQGYQVQYCQNKDFTGETLHSSAYATKTECDLGIYPKAGETWYVRVRSYIKNSSGTKYGIWSSASSIKLVYEITDVTLSQDVFAYSGKAVKVGSYITVKSGSTKLKYGTDYTMEYADHSAQGINTAKVTVTGIGNYTGTITKTYTIAPAKQAAPILTAVSGGFKVSWTADATAAGYQVLYSKDPTFSTSDPSYHAQTYAAGKTSVTLTKYSQTGETWYVKVRAFITADGTTSGTKYGVFSETASIVAG